MKIYLKSIGIIMICAVVLMGCNDKVNQQLEENTIELEELIKQNSSLEAIIQDLKAENIKLKAVTPNSSQWNNNIEIREVHNFSKDLNEKIEEEIKEDEWATSYFYLNGKTYVLLGSPKNRKTSGIDIDGLNINDRIITIYYQTFDYHDVLPGIKKRLLYEIDGEYKVDFLATYSTEQ